MKKSSTVRIMSHAQSDCVCPENPEFIHRLACNAYNLHRYVKANPQGILGEVEIFFLSFFAKSIVYKAYVCQAIQMRTYADRLTIGRKEGESLRKLC